VGYRKTRCYSLQGKRAAGKTNRISDNGSEGKGEYTGRTIGIGFRGGKIFKRKKKHAGAFLIKSHKRSTSWEDEKEKRSLQNPFLRGATRGIG